MNEKEHGIIKSIIHEIHNLTVQMEIFRERLIRNSKLAYLIAERHSIFILF